MSSRSVTAQTRIGDLRTDKISVAWLVATRFISTSASMTPSPSVPALIASGRIRQVELDGGDFTTRFDLGSRHRPQDLANAQTIQVEKVRKLTFTQVVVFI